MSVVYNACMMRSLRRPIKLILSAIALGLSSTAGAQTRSVDGRVVHPDRAAGDSTGMAPLAAAWVTLHRVGRDAAGPVDSTRTDATGRYRFRWTTQGAAEAVYFASVSWDGIAYFTSPLREAVTSGDAAEISVFDTTTSTFPLTVRGRHLIVSGADTNNVRTIIEVFELSNDSVKALVASEDDNAVPTWSIAVPAGAADVRASDGDIAPDAFTFAPGRVSVFAPIAPGLKQLSFSYKLPTARFPVTFVAEHGAVVFEILLEEAQGGIKGGGFSAVEAVNLEGRRFRRYLAQDVNPNASFEVDLPSSNTNLRNYYISALLAAIGFMMLLVLLRAMQRRTTSSSAGTLGARQQQSGMRVDVPLAERLAQEIAALDATYALQDSHSEDVQFAYDRRRAELVEALSESLADAQVSL